MSGLGGGSLIGRQRRRGGVRANVSAFEARRLVIHKIHSAHGRDEISQVPFQWLVRDFHPTFFLGALKLLLSSSGDFY